MKRSILLLSLSCLLFAQGKKRIDLSWVDQQIEAIKPPRKGISYREISYLKDPFIFLEKNRSKKIEKEVPAPLLVPNTKETTTSENSIKKVLPHPLNLKLAAVINNAALINGDWYKVGDIVNGYKVTKVTLKEVIVEKGGKRHILTTYTKTKH